jgi:hypothetical protein
MQNNMVVNPALVDILLIENASRHWIRIPFFFIMTNSNLDKNEQTGIK